MADYSLYEILDVEPDADDAAIKAAYRRAVRTAHPDAGGSAAIFGMIREAYDVLSDPDRRAAYDESRQSANAHLRADDQPSTSEPEWGEEVPYADAHVDDGPTSTNDGGLNYDAFNEPRMPFWLTARYVIVRVALVAVEIGLFYLLAQPIWSRTIKPDDAGPDLLNRVGFLLDGAVLAYIVCIVASLVGYYYAGLATLTGLALLGWIVWPFAYWDVATGGERWSYVGWVLMWLVYQGILVFLLIGRWTTASDERAREETT